MLSVACCFLIGGIVFPVSVNRFLKYHVCMAMNNTVKGLHYGFCWLICNKYALKSDGYCPNNRRLSAQKQLHIFFYLTY
jgi:hypothetical protein